MNSESSLSKADILDGAVRTVRAGRQVKLSRGFYTREDTIAVARDLLGKRLVVPAPTGERVSGLIVEAEAYLGIEDRAAHSFGGRRTARTETMYAVGGTVYVFFVYGMHFQFNVVAGKQGVPHAILIRALEPEEGTEIMRVRRGEKADRDLTNGPGKLTQAFGIDRSFDREDLRGERVWIEDAGVAPTHDQIMSGPRVGIDYAGEHALHPLRFWLKGNAYVSRAK
jgi:DNA-3-methyladenine glycosylase